MPRPIRPDLRPTIWVPDTSEARQRAHEAIGPASNLGVSVYQKGHGNHFARLYNAFHNWIAFLRTNGEKIDHEVLNCMISHLDFADARSQGPANRNGLVPHILYVPGCRVVRTQTQIAHELDCSSERIRLAIKKLSLCDIIVNSGKGWYEFDASFVWKGREEFRLPYLSIQEKKINIK